MTTIWKYPVLSPNGIVEMPAGAKVIHVHEQHGNPCLWAEVDPDADIVDRVVEVVPTNGTPDGENEYVGTVHLKDLYGDPIVFHIYVGAEL